MNVPFNAFIHIPDTAVADTKGPVPVPSRPYVRTTGPWNDERDALLAELLEKGHSFARCAEIIGSEITKNAAIGRAHRLGLKALKKPAQVVAPLPPRPPRVQKHNLVGKRFGALVVLERFGDDGSKGVFWNCECKCGAIVKRRASNLRETIYSSCGGPRCLPVRDRKVTLPAVRKPTPRASTGHVKPLPWLSEDRARAFTCDDGGSSIEFMQLVDGVCKWPFDIPDEPVRYCGVKALAGYSWCEGHARRVWQLARHA